MKTEILKLAKSDYVKGLIMAVLTVIVGGAKVFLTGILSTPSVYPTLAQVEHLGLLGLTVGIAYLFKNFLTNSQDQFLIKEPQK